MGFSSDIILSKDIIKRAGLRTAVFSFEPMCVVVIIAIQFKSANQRPQNLWLTGQKIVVSLCGHRKCYKKRQNSKSNHQSVGFLLFTRSFFL